MDEKSNYTENLKQVLFLAEKLAGTYGSSYIASEHLLYAMLTLPECNAYKILSTQGVSVGRYENYFIRLIDSKSDIKGLTAETRDMIQKAKEMSNTVTTVHLLMAIMSFDDCLAVCVLRALGTDFHKLAMGIEHSLNSEVEQ